MKTIFLGIVLLAISCHFLPDVDAASVRLVSCPSEVSNGCPYPQGQIPVYFAHPNDCSKFCECGMEGIAWEVQCMPGLLWNDGVQTCDWASNVNCGDRPVPGEPVTEGTR
ncbi:hypothetical protein SK128_000873 [Halocaridina rubra]|uniref:Chitin-binding type-2 domain-containing protein n=1 Tax=Halocaridina rubra TaxID=373956 RepID=A0AAN8WQ79_HALRR